MPFLNPPRPLRAGSAAAVRALPPLAGALLALLLAAAAPAGEPAPITPRQPIALFNGKDLSAFETWIPMHTGPDWDQVFTVVDQIDGAPAIRISGQRFGGLLTRESFTRYRLVAEFRWGLVTWHPRADKSRDSGILLHCQGEPGNASPRFDSPWMRSVEYQIIEGGTGDFILIGGHARRGGELIPVELTVAVPPGGKNWSPDGVPTRYQRGRINWQHRDPEWKDVLGVRGSKDVEKPVGEWNLIEVICDGPRIISFLNGVKVNEGTESSIQAGRLLFQTEGAELYFRRIELHPLSAPAPRRIPETGGS